MAKQEVQKQEKMPERITALRQVVDKIFDDTKKERDKMDEYLRHFRGEIWKEEELDSLNSRGFINTFFQTVESIAPMLTDSHPITYVVPKFPFLEKLGRLYNNGLKYIWDKTDDDMKTLKITLSALIMKIGIKKIYWNPDKNELDSDIVDPRSFFILPGYEDEWDAPMMGEREMKPVSWLKRQFPEMADQIEETKDPEIKTNFKFGETKTFSEDIKFARFYRVWSRDDQEIEELTETGETQDDTSKKKKKKYEYGKWVCFTDDLFLGEFNCDYFHNKPPYICLRDYFNPFDFLGIGEGDQISALCKELNLQFQRIMDQSRRHHAPNFLMDVNGLADPQDVKDNFFKGNRVISYDSSSRMNIQTPVIQQIPDGNLNIEILRLFQELPEIIQKVAGVNDLSQGIVSKNERQSAAELGILAEGTHTRTRQRIRNLEFFLKRDAYLKVSMMMQFYTDPKRIFWQDGNDLVFAPLDNTFKTADQMLKPISWDEAVKLSPEEWNKTYRPDESQEMYDYMEFIKVYGGGQDGATPDPVFFDFDIVVQTDSTLPIDKQSRANLALSLFRSKAIDAQALLEVLQFPNAGPTIARMKQAEQKPAGPMPPQGVQ